MPLALHRRWVEQFHDPFHVGIAEAARVWRRARGERALWHLDLHSMPSRGTGAHADGGQLRPEVVVSDFDGRAASPHFMDAVCEAFSGAGFQVSRNWPYRGGRITQRYGRPEAGHETIQIELNRALYMDETSRKPLPEWGGVPPRLEAALLALARARSRTLV
jgi:N-formylglutamate deformylase